VIASDACGAAELVEQSGCGRVVRADDPEALNEAISWVIELKPQERKHPCEKALSIAEQLTIPKLSNKLLSYCHEALELYSANTLPSTK
jgi:glycosyltransferase involved in cell wall biosynthesis